MITIRLNGSPRTLAPGSTLSALVAEVTGRKVRADGHSADGGRLGIAVARNSAVVSRTTWATTGLQDGDDIEIVGAVQGG
ncbi:sulfur carrier protein ThiS [Luethyella okanaganae]|uniref:Sulfur carrier protein ThiS n=1 Tax=Luethyella okanaganae TaxID=69372 RepID=A0ABW1VF99_9MICO